MNNNNTVWTIYPDIFCEWPHKRLNKNIYYTASSSLSCRHSWIESNFRMTTVFRSSTALNSDRYIFYFTVIAPMFSYLEFSDHWEFNNSV